MATIVAIVRDRDLDSSANDTSRLCARLLSVLLSVPFTSPSGRALLMSVSVFANIITR